MFSAVKTAPPKNFNSVFISVSTLKPTLPLLRQFNFCCIFVISILLIKRKKTGTERPVKNYFDQLHNKVYAIKVQNCFSKQFSFFYDGRNKRIALFCLPN